MINIRHQMVQKIAVILLILLSVIFGVFRFFIAPGDYVKDTSFVAKWDANIAGLKSKIPPETKIVGYISDLNIEDNAEQQGAVERNELLLTRYSMAPMIVRTGVKPEWIIGNSTNPAFMNILKGKIKGTYTVEKQGYGIFLIHRGK